MIKYIKGNLLEAPAQALVNTINTVGVMGKGIALQFKEAFPNNYSRYVEACKTGWLQPGRLLVVTETSPAGDKIIINFPTKTQWRLKSKYEYIESGLIALTAELDKGQIKSIAIPPLGCGNGGLRWSRVKQLIEQYLSRFTFIEVLVYEPDDSIQTKLKEGRNDVEVKLTPARSMLLYAMYYYEASGEPNSLFVANKLAWFLQRMGENLRLKFEASFYGPYSVQVGHVLHRLNGKYLRGLEQMTVKAFETIDLEYSTFSEVKEFITKELTPEQRQRINNLTRLIDGFQSALSLETLATVDYIRSEKSISELDAVIKVAQSWSLRKRNLLNDRYIAIAYNHLNSFSDIIPYN